MWKLPTAIFCSVIIAGLALALSAPTSSPALIRIAKSGPVIACFHPKLDRFTAQAHPNRCNIAGYRGEELVENPIKGTNWGHWGSNPTRAAYGSDRRDGTAVRVIAHRPIACDEGRTWYSRVVIVTPGDGNGFVLRLPTCSGPSVVG